MTPSRSFHIGRVGIEGGELVEIAVERQRAGVPDGHAVQQHEAALFHERPHLLRVSGLAHDGGLGGENDQLPRLAPHGLEPPVVTEVIVPKNEALEVFQRQRRGQSRHTGPAVTVNP